MNPLFTWIIAKTVARALTRRCPVCRHEQVVPHDRHKKRVKCGRCGAKMLPRVKPK